MSLKHLGMIELPASAKAGGFDHAAVHRASSRLYVAHTANDALDVIDCATDTYLHSIENLGGIAGALVSDEAGLVFTSNRGENSVGLFAPDDEDALVKVDVGLKPNGLAFDAKLGLLLAANVGDPAQPDTHTLSVVDVAERRMIASIPVPGRTRWTIFDAQSGRFFVNIAQPAQIVAVDSADPTRVAHSFAIPAEGPHGLDFDLATNRLFCACDGRALLTLDASSGALLNVVGLSGVPDVIFFNAVLKKLYVAVGDPGVIDVFETTMMTRVEVVPTERGAHTIAFDAERNKVITFLPQTHRAMVFADA